MHFGCLVLGVWFLSLGLPGMLWFRGWLGGC